MAGLISIAAVLEEPIYRCLLFRVLERTWGTGAALVVQAVVFALLYLANVEQGGSGDVMTMLVSTSVVVALLLRAAQRRGAFLVPAA